MVGTDPIDDYRPLLEEVGFTVEAYEETHSWRERLVATYEAVLARREAITEEMGEEAIGPLSWNYADVAGTALPPADSGRFNSTVRS